MNTMELEVALSSARARRAEVERAVLVRRVRAVARAERRVRRATLQAQRAQAALRDLPR